jgi:hypothetical protein
MHFLLEAVFVGIYCDIIYLSLLKWISQISVLLFCVGFLKHLLGGILEIHDYYCNYGYACIRDGKYVSIHKDLELFLAAIIEGVMFLVIGNIFIYGIAGTKYNLLVLFFTLGAVFHIVFELLGIHSLFCKERCAEIVV